GIPDECTVAIWVPSGEKTTSCACGGSTTTSAVMSTRVHHHRIGAGFGILAGTIDRDTQVAPGDQRFGTGDHDQFRAQPPYSLNLAQHHVHVGQSLIDIGPEAVALRPGAVLKADRCRAYGPEV